MHARCDGIIPIWGQNDLVIIIIRTEVNVRSCRWNTGMVTTETYTEIVWQRLWVIVFIYIRRYYCFLYYYFHRIRRVWGSTEFPVPSIRLMHKSYQVGSGFYINSICRKYHIIIELSDWQIRASKGLNGCCKITLKVIKRNIKTAIKCWKSIIQDIQGNCEWFVLRDGITTTDHHIVI